MIEMPPRLNESDVAFAFIVASAETSTVPVPTLMSGRKAVAAKADALATAPAAPATRGPKSDR